MKADMERGKGFRMGEPDGRGRAAFFTVTAPGKKTAKPAHGMPEGHARRKTIGRFPYVDPFDLQIKGNGRNSGQKSAEKDQPAVPDLKNVYKMVLIGFKIKDHIHESCTDEGRYQDNKKNIAQSIR